MVTTLDGDLYMSFGVMGGFMQPQGQVQVLLNHLYFGMDPQAALDAPRFCIDSLNNSQSSSTTTSTTSPSFQFTNVSKVLLEEGISLQVKQQLCEMGHEVEMRTGHEREVFGRGQIILKDPHTGVLKGGSDKRGDGYVGGNK